MLEAIDHWLWIAGGEPMTIRHQPPELAGIVAIVPEIPVEEAGGVVDDAAETGNDEAVSYWASGRNDFESCRFAEALESFRKLLAVRPRHRAASLNAALCLERLGRDAEAESVYHQALEQDPTHPEINWRFGMCLLRLGKDEDAATAFGRCLDQKPSFTPASLGKAVALHRLGKLDAAQALYASPPAAGDGYAAVLTNLIAIAAAREDHAKLREYGEELLRLRRQSRSALEALMQAEMATHDYKAALQHGTRLVKCAADSYEAWFNLGLCYQKTNHAEHATQAYAEALKIQPEGARAHANLGVIMQAHGDISGARREFERVLAHEPDDLATLWNLAIVYERDGHVAKAGQIYLRLIQDQYHVFAAAFRLGRLRLDGKNYVEAAEAFERCLLEREDAAAEINLALAWWRSGDLSSANSTLQGVLAKNPDSLEGLYLLATLAINAGDWKTAQEIEARLCGLGENTSGLVYNIGVLQQRTNLPAEAIRSFQRACEQKAGFAEALLNLGHALMKSGQADQGRAAWKAALEARPELARDYFKGATASASA